MRTSERVAIHMRNLFQGGNWTDVSFKDLVEDVSFEEAVREIGDFNTIAKLCFHIHYFVKVTLPVLEGGTLDAHDKYSYDLPELQSAEQWEKMKANILSDANCFSELIAQLSDEELFGTFVAEKYGDYWTNLVGIIEHSHYHLGQIALLKKWMRTSP